MKKLWSKNLTIALFFLSNVGMATYIVAKDGDSKPVSVRAVQKKHIKLATRKSSAPVRSVAAPAPAPVAPPIAARKGRVVAVEPNNENSGLQACYDAYLSRIPQPQDGSILLHWTVDQSGHATSIQLVRSELHDEIFSNCVLSRIKEAVFTPAPNGEKLLVSHKYSFRQRAPANVDIQ